MGTTYPTTAAPTGRRPRPTADAPPPAAAARDVVKRWGDDRPAALAGVTLEARPGEWVALVGPSGCGKSTLLHLLGGLDLPTSGTVELAGQVMGRRGEGSRARLRRRHVGYVFQQYNLLDDLDVVGNVELPLLLNGVPRRAARARARALLDQLGLGASHRAAPARLSGGQQQRVAVARALAARPTLVLADEPTGALDSVAAASVVAALAEAHRAGQTLVMATHDPQVAAAADRVITLRDGLVVGEVG